MEDILELSELRDITAAAGIGMWRIELINGSQPKMYANRKMMHLLGFEDEDLSPEDIYTWWFSRIKPEAVESVIQSVSRMESGSRDENTYLWEHPTKGERYVRCGGTAKKVQGGYVLRGYHYDVDFIVRKEKQAEVTVQKALLLAEQTNAEIRNIHQILGSGDWSMTFDADSRMTSCTWSAKFRQMIGYSSTEDFPDELESWSDLLDKEDRDRIMKAYWDVVNDRTGRKTYDVYYRLMTKDRGERWFHAIGRVARRADGSPEKFYGMFLDVDSEYRRQQDEIEQNAAIIEAISQEYHTMWFVYKSDLSSRFIRSNGHSTIQKAVAIAEGEGNADDKLKRYIDTYVVEEDRERVERDTRSDVVMREIKRQPIYTVNYRRIDEEGRITYHQLAFADAGEGYVTAFHDIDSLIRDQQEKQQILKDALAAADAANKAKSAFLQSMSHDIRTPMNGIIGMTAIAASHIDDKARVQDALQKITQASRHLLALINEVLDMSRIESGKVTLEESDFNLSELVDNLVAMIRPQVLEHGHDLSVNIEGVRNELVIGDALRLQQVLVNLLSNAIKYTPDGGRISLSIKERPCSQDRLSCYEFSVKDNGIGMSEDFVKQIFEPFTRADDGRVSKIQGTGLGMPIAKNIVSMMGGDIKVDSHVGEGSTFTVTIFLRLQQQSGAETSSEASFADLSVLVADDDSTSVENTVSILGELGMQAEGVLSGKEAVGKVVSRHEERRDYNAVILDWKMPGMDGLETTRRIRAEVGSDVPIIILSAYDWSDIEKEAREAGVNAFVSKPLFKSRLKRVFSELFAQDGETGSENTPLESLEEMNLSGHRCLLVEDNELNAEIAEDILGETGLEIDHAWNGEEAVEKVMNAEDGRYDIVFMDIRMPKMNGYEATKAIRASDRAYCRQVPIIAMTANAFAEDIQASIAAGMDEHIAKPLDVKALGRVLDKWIIQKKK